MAVEQEQMVTLSRELASQKQNRRVCIFRSKVFQFCDEPFPARNCNSFVILLRFMVILAKDLEVAQYFLPELFLI